MKKLYFFILFFTGIFTFSQIPYEVLLQNVDWKIYKIEIAGTEYLPPEPIGISPTTNFEFGHLTSRFYNFTSGSTSFGANNANYFTLGEVTTSLVDYWGDNYPAVQQFDGLVTNFYLIHQLSDPFYFVYEEAMSGKNLTVTKINGDKIYYSNLILSTSESQKKMFSIYPNPISDKLTISGAENISNYSILDASGKILLQNTLISTKNLEVDFQKFPAGVYYIKLNDKEIHKIIKK